MSMEFQSNDSALRRYEDLTEALEQGHLNKASRMLRETMATAGSHIDPLLLKRAEALAERYYDEGEYIQAAAMFRALHEVQSCALGKDHPLSKQTQRKLAEALWQVGGVTPKLLSTMGDH